MYTISTSVFVSVLALVSSLAGVVQADGPRPSCFHTDEVRPGETCDTFAKRFNTDAKSLKDMNDWITCNGLALPIWFLCTAMGKPTCTKWVDATSTTCNELATENNLSIQGFYDLNDNVNQQCTDLTQNKSYCVASD